MKKYIRLFFLFTLFISACSAPLTRNDSTVKQDSLPVRDSTVRQMNITSGFTFKTIGKQVWTTENLNVCTFANGDTISEVNNEGWMKAGEEGKPAWCWYDFDSSNGKKFGRLYNWFAVNDKRGLAPKGWHIPTEAEWDELVNFLGGYDVAGIKMKSTQGWNDFNGENGNGNNSSGFNGIPVCGYDGDFGNPGTYASYWTSTVRDEHVVNSRLLNYFNPTVTKFTHMKEYGAACRCIKDE